MTETAHDRDSHLCPCCRAEVPGEAASGTICHRCWWKDDGQGDDEATIVRGTANGALSLETARTNCHRFGAMYPPPKSRTLRALGRMGENHPRAALVFICAGAISVIAYLVVILWFVLPYSGNSATLGQSPGSIRAMLVLLVLPVGMGVAALLVRMDARRAEQYDPGPEDLSNRVPADAEAGTASIEPRPAPQDHSPLGG